MSLKWYLIVGCLGLAGCFPDSSNLFGPPTGSYQQKSPQKPKTEDPHNILCRDRNGKEIIRWRECMPGETIVSRFGS